MVKYIPSRIKIVRKKLKNLKDLAWLLMIKEIFTKEFSKMVNYSDHK